MSTITIGSNSYNLIAAPASPGLVDVTLGMNDTVSSNISPFTRQEQVQQWPGADFWDAQFTLPPMCDAQAGNWEAFMAALQGRANVFQLGDPRRPKPLGSALGAPVVSRTGTWVCPAGVTSIVVIFDSGNCTIANGETLAFSNAYFAELGIGLNMATLANFNVAGTGTPSGYAQSDSAAITVQPGTTYVLGATIDATQVTSIAGGGVPYVGIFNVGVSSEYYQLGQNPGVIGQVGNQNSAWTNTLQTTGWKATNFRLLMPRDYLQVGYRLHIATAPVNSDANGNAAISIWPSLREQPADGTQIVLHNPVGLFRLAQNRRQSQFSPQQLTRLSISAVEAR